MNRITFVIIVLMTKAMLYILYAIEYVSAKKHNTAFEQDTDDADLANSTGPDNCHLYIHSDNSFAQHSKEFNKNYIKGNCDHSPLCNGSEADEATFDCPK
jgi:hypothetical protein